MSGTLEHKRAATQAVKSLGLQADLRARALVLVAADSTVGNSLRDLIQLNEDDPALKALVEELLRGEVTGTGGHGRDVSAEGTSSSDLVKLRGKVKVLKKGDPETGDTKSISLYRSGHDPPSLKNKDGHLAGRLYLKNVNIMVPADTATVEVVAPMREIRPPFLPEENSNGLSEELFAFDSVIRVSSYTGLSLVDDLAQDITSCLVNAFPTLIGPYLAWRQQFVHSKPD
ncbi:hypothetical protein ABBQ38_009809 [Trebouxia sp. C0009 RCD-2024]